MLPKGIATIGVGEHNYFRGLVADTIDLTLHPTSGGGKPGLLATPTGDRSGLTYAAEYNSYDGPWDKEGNASHVNGFLKYFKESGPDTFSLTAMA